jgi:hypothetical protein
VVFVLFGVFDLPWTPFPQKTSSRLAAARKSEADFLIWIGGLIDTSFFLSVVDPRLQI